MKVQSRDHSIPREFLIISWSAARLSTLENSCAKSTSRRDDDGSGGGGEGLGSAGSAGELIGETNGEGVDGTADGGGDGEDNGGDGDEEAGSGGDNEGGGEDDGEGGEASGDAQMVKPGRVTVVSARKRIASSSCSDSPDGPLVPQ